MVTALGNYETTAVPRIVPLYTTDSYATITTAGFLNNVGGSSQLLSTDILAVNYNNGTNQFFNISIDSSKVITLSLSAGQIILPVEPGRIPQFDTDTGVLEDSGIGSNEVLTTNSSFGVFSGTDFQQFFGLSNVILASAGTWTRTRVAEGNYVLRHTAADDTSILGVDITPIIRLASGFGFKLSSMDVIYNIGTLALDAHSITLDKISYANNTAVLVTSVPLTGTLATATQAQPYLTNMAVTTPAFNNTTNSKYVAELTVNAAATSAYDFYGLNLRFTKTSL